MKRESQYVSLILSGLSDVKMKRYRGDYVAKLFVLMASITVISIDNLDKINSNGMSVP